VCAQALYVVALYEALYELYPSYRSGVGIIAPYKSQRRLLKSLFRDRFGPSMGNVEISTIDGFQGREKEIVIFSCVRAPSHGRGNQGGVKCTACVYFYLLHCTYWVEILLMRVGIWAESYHIMCVQNASQAGEPARHITCHRCHCTLQCTVIVNSRLSAVPLLTPPLNVMQASVSYENGSV
jgi:AAA domain